MSSVEPYSTESAAPRFDYGAALRVPPSLDVGGWRRLEQWLGDKGYPHIETGVVREVTPRGEREAHCGDWIVLTVAGEFHIARGDRPLYDA